MAQTKAVQLWDSVYRRTDKQIRDLIGDYQRDPSQREVEVDTINVVVGDLTTALAAGVVACLRVDFRARLTGYFLQEFDGTSGSVTFNIHQSTGGSSPSWALISAATPAGISSGRYYADETLEDWANTALARGDYLRFSIASASTITRVLLTLRVTRLEP